MKSCKFSKRGLNRLNGYPRVWDRQLKRDHIETRVVLEKKLGRSIQSGYRALHICDHPTCIEPTHLYEGTQLDNAQDRSARGRTAVGLRNGRSVLTEHAVRYVKRSSASHSALARRFSVDPKTIRQIRSGHTWRHVQ